MPLIRVRNALRVWHQGFRDDVWRIAAIKSVDLDPRTVMVLLEELRDRGILGSEEKEEGVQEDGLTEAGLALTGANARNRTPNARAAAILERFLDACVAVNARDDVPFDVQRVWLFGSMLDPEIADVGDVDLVIEQVGPARYPTPKSAHQRFVELAREMGAVEQSGLMSIFGPSHFVERQLLHGGRRHPLLSINTKDELLDMACPCRLIFDAERGGRVSDPILHRHPESNGRSNRIGDKRRMPNLSEGCQALRPVSAALMTGRCIGYRTLKAVGPWPSDSPRYRMIDRYISSMGIIAEGVDPPRHDANALTKRMRFKNCDGRCRTGLLLIETKAIEGDWRNGYARRPVIAAVIERSIQHEGDQVRYKLDFTEADHLGRGFEHEHILTFEWWTYVVASIDVERILRREQELQLDLNLSVEISFSASGSIASALADTKDLDANILELDTRARLTSQWSL